MMQVSAMANDKPIYPKPLSAGDSVAIISPAYIIKPELVYGEMEVLQDQGWRPQASEAVFARYGSFAGDISTRLEDLRQAWESPDIRAVFCSRGGYGVVHLLDEWSKMSFKNPKWVSGFSDITAMHSLLTTKGIVSVHSCNASWVSQLNSTDSLSQKHIGAQELLNILRGGGVDISIEADTLNVKGDAEGILVGGNLAVLAGLIGTPYDVIRPGVVLFIEDVDEPIYKIERILYQLKMRGVLPRLAGLVVGQFTGYNVEENHNKEFASMYAMIQSMVAEYGYPVAFNFPIGHGDDNRPVLCGARVHLHVGDDRVRLRQPGALDEGQR
ncbi:MAG: LD-carboxypeptidase [Muribaculaceae bacterium]|nr:LD-carboxypeptidase [Muribaculaceae bacterium]